MGLEQELEQYSAEDPRPGGGQWAADRLGPGGREGRHQLSPRGGVLVHARVRGNDVLVCYARICGDAGTGSTLFPRRFRSTPSLCSRSRAGGSRRPCSLPLVDVTQKVSGAITMYIHSHPIGCFILLLHQKPSNDRREMPGGYRTQETHAVLRMMMEGEEEAIRLKGQVSRHDLTRPTTWNGNPR